MAFVYKGSEVGKVLAYYVVDRAAAGLPFDTIRLQIARDFDGQSLSEELFDKILADNQPELVKREEEMLKKIDSTNPVSIILDAVERLKELSDRSQDVKEVSTALATMRGYVEMLSAKGTAKKEGKKGSVFIQQQSAVTIDAAQRGFQVMRHRVSEGFQFTRLGFKLVGALCHTLFQFEVQAAYCLVSTQALQAGCQLT